VFLFIWWWNCTFCSSSSSNDDDKLDKPMTEAMDGLYGEAPLEEHVVNGINTRFALCSSMSGSILSTYFLLIYVSCYL
jgi:hypothetical protein